MENLYHLIVKIALRLANSKNNKSETQNDTE